MPPLRAQQVIAIYIFVTMAYKYYYHNSGNYLLSCLLFKTRRHGDWIVSAFRRNLLSNTTTTTTTITTRVQMAYCQLVILLSVFSMYCERFAFLPAA
jgi:hypothetical protein